MKRGILCLGLCAFLAIPASFVQAEIISINARYFADRATVQGYFYSSGDTEGNFVVLDFRFGVSGMGGWTEEYLCEEKWEWNRIIKAATDVAKYINERDNVHALTMLADLGFEKCRTKN